MKKLKDMILNCEIKDCRDNLDIVGNSSAFEALKENLINYDEFLKQLKYDTDVGGGVDISKNFDLEITLLEDKELGNNEGSFLILEFYFSQNEFEFSRKYNMIGFF